MKNNILFIGPYPPPYSGPELGMKLFLESSLKDNFNICFLKTNVRKSNANKGRFDYHMIIAFFVFISKLIYMILRSRPEVAYYPITPTQIGWVGRDIWCLLICRLFGVKTIIHLRGSHFNLNFTTFHSVVRKLIKYTCRYVSLALVQANCLKNQFDGLIPEDKVKVLYNAITPDEYDNDKIMSYSSYNILFMGHMTKAKGYCDLVRAIPIVAEKFKDIKFCFAGTLRKGERGVFFNQTNGESIEYEDPFIVHNDISAGKYQSNYKHLGVISGKKKLDALRHTNVFILPSYSEGFSRSLLEAMSMGKPVICTPVGAHKDVISDGVNGFFVKPGDTEMIAQKIITMLEDSEKRNQIAETNYKYVRNNFHINLIARQMEKYIEQVININD
jgi:glycosyltransferase involved in cell wall biosynthesis